MLDSTEILETETTANYTEQLQTLTNQVEYLTKTNQSILISINFIIAVCAGVGVCFILHKFLKIFL